MQVEIRPGTLRDVSFIAANMRDEDWREVRASGPIDDRATAGMICWAASPGYSWTAWLRGEPVCAFGFAAGGLPWVWSAWAFGTGRIRRAIPAVSRFGRQTVAPMLIEAGVRRVEIRSIAGHDLAHRWLSGLGATRECDLVEYGRDGETFTLWSWTRDAWLASGDAGDPGGDGNDVLLLSAQDA